MWNTKFLVLSSDVHYISLEKRKSSLLSRNLGKMGENFEFQFLDRVFFESAVIMKSKQTIPIYIVSLKSVGSSSFIYKVCVKDTEWTIYLKKREKTYLT